MAKTLNISKHQLSFNHKEILNLYNFGTEIPQNLLHQIIELPRESVIADLEKILIDAVDRYEDYSNEDWDESTNKIVFHAIYLLAELEAKESLPEIIVFLENDEEIVDYWVDEFLTDTYWQPLYKLGQNQLELLKKLLLNPDVSIFAKIAVSEAMAQMVLQIPEKRNEIINIYMDVLEFYKNQLIETDSEEDELITYFIEDTSKCRLIELKPVIEVLYDKNLIDMDYLLFPQYLDNLKNEDPLYFKVDILDIFQTYHKINSELEDFHNDIDDDDDDDDDNNFNNSKSIISNRILNSCLPAGKVDLPDFKHKIVEELFEYNMTISQDTLKTILELPREEIVPDLIMVIDFAIVNSSLYYRSDKSDKDGSKTNFPLHAMYLLAEMREEKALEIILKFLSQKEKYLDYWLGDFLTEEIWKILLLTGNRKLPDLAKVVTDYKFYEYVRFAASQAMAQTTIYYPEKRDEAFSLFQDILNKYLQREIPEDLFSDEVLGSVITDLTEIKAFEFINLIKDCFDKKIVDEFYTGPFKDVENEFKNKNIREYPIGDIFNTYNTIITKWSSYIDSDDDDSDMNNINDDDYDYNPGNIISSGEQFIRENPKIGRNDPCPCGSGKKYKKCCLDK